MFWKDIYDVLWFVGKMLLYAIAVLAGLAMLSLWERHRNHRH